MLRVNNLKQAFGDNVILDDVSFSLNAGEIIGLVAPNGTGKSTLLHIIMNFLNSDDGDVTIENGEEVYDYSSEKNEVQMHKQVSFLPELEHLYMDLSGRDHLNYYARLWGENTDIVDEVIERLNISSYVDTRVRTYSLGMRQRLAFAMILCTDTPIMLMDEVMNGLDPDNVTMITEILIDLKKRKKTIIIASHLLDNLDIYADRIMFLKEGKITFNNRKEQNDWSDQYVKVTLSPGQLKIIEESFRLPKDFRKMRNDLFVIPLAGINQEQFNDLLALFFEQGIYDFSVSQIGTKERYDLYYEK